MAAQTHQKTYESAECAQYDGLADERVVAATADLIKEEGYEVLTCDDAGPVKVISASMTGDGKSFSVQPFLMIKMEHFAGTTLITLATWGKIRTRAKYATVLTLGLSAMAAVPGGLHQKKGAAKFYEVFWDGLKNVMGEYQVVASSVREKELSSVVLWCHEVDPTQAEGMGLGPDGRLNKAWDATEGIYTGVEAAKVGLEVAADAGLATVEVAGAGVLPLIGVGFGAAKLAAAKNNTQRGSAIGMIAGSATLIPLAGAVGALIGHAIGKQITHLTHFEKVEEQLTDKKEKSTPNLGPARQQAGNGIVHLTADGAPLPAAQQQQQQQQYEQHHPQQAQAPPQQHRDLQQQQQQQAPQQHAPKQQQHPMVQGPSLVKNLPPDFTNGETPTFKASAP